MFVIDYDCITAAGPGPESLMQALNDGRICSRPALEDQWPQQVSAGGLVALLPDRVSPSHDRNQAFESSQSYLSRNLTKLWENIQQRLLPETLKKVSGSRIGLIFASTKGSIEDSIYEMTRTQENEAHPDPFIGICEEFKGSSPIPFTSTLTLSNACSSSHVALEYIQELFVADRMDYALLIAADLIGPFIYKGFDSLKVVSRTRNSPFCSDRDGLQLGEALTCVLLSREKRDSSFQIAKVASNTEGSSITRPSLDGRGLLRTLTEIKEFKADLKPDFVIAHGTGTLFNDQTEDRALADFLSGIDRAWIPITGTKWSIGHTLGASGSVDLISACQVLKNQQLFSIGVKGERDPKLQMNHFLNKRPMKGHFKQALITSLGFGGVHASLLLEKILEPALETVTK